MNRLTIFLILALIQFSCSNDLKKSVFEPLDQVIITNQIKEDTTFKKFYENTRKLADSVFIPKESFFEYQEIQYSSLWQYEKDSEKTYQDLIKDEKSRVEWENLFSSDLERFDRDSIKYINYIKENYYKNFVEIEPQKIYEQLDWTSFNTYVTLIFTPKNGNTIRKFSGTVHFVPIETEYDTLSRLLNSSRMYAHFFYKGNSKNNFQHYASTSSKELNKIEGLPMDIIKQKYNIVFYPIELVIEDRFIDVSFEEIPNDIRSYLLDDLNFYKESYIKQNINKEYFDFYNYIWNKVSEEMNLKYPLESKFIKEGWDKYYE